MVPEESEPPARRKRWGALGSVAQQGLRQGKRVAIFVVGGTVVLFGALLLVLPGPGIPIVIAGLAILAIEFAWARRWLRRGKLTTKAVKRSVLRRFRRRKQA
jgi:uncharacterized protein (TIGR02611 family)